MEGGDTMRHGCRQLTIYKEGNLAGTVEYKLYQVLYLTGDLKGGMHLESFGGLSLADNTQKLNMP